MKFFTTFCVLLFCTILLKAQIPNADFENWSGGSPVGWFADNVPPSLIPVTQTSDAESGSSAVKGEIVSSLGATLTPLIVAGTSNNNQGIAINQRYPSVTGYYKFTPVQNDSMIIIVVMYKNGINIGSSVVEPAPAGTYSPFSANINYTTSAVPDTCKISISIINPAGSTSIHAGSVMYVDNLSFGTVTGIKSVNSLPHNFSLKQNYPNPFNPSTNIKYTLSSSGFVSVGIYNLLGKRVKSLVNKSQGPGNHEVMVDMKNYASGVYFYRINVRSARGKSFTSIKKMILMK